MENRASPDGDLSHAEIAATLDVFQDGSVRGGCRCVSQVLGPRRAAAEGNSWRVTLFCVGQSSVVEGVRGGMSGLNCVRDRRPDRASGTAY
jgi:hypothetical protein